VCAVLCAVCATVLFYLPDDAHTFTYGANPSGVSPLCKALFLGACACNTTERFACILQDVGCRHCCQLHCTCMLALSHGTLCSADHVLSSSTLLLLRLLQLSKTTLACGSVMSTTRPYFAKVVLHHRRLHRSVTTHGLKMSHVEK
jgi:hypothetical protein